MPTTSDSAPIPQDNISNRRLYWSLAAILFGSFLLRTAAGVMGETIQFYFNYIHEAAITAHHPLAAFVGAGQLSPISYTLGGIIIGAFFVTELIGSPLFGTWSDRYGRKIFILLGPILGAIAVQITAMTTAIWLLFFTRLLEGLSTASNAPSTLGYIAEATSVSPSLRLRITGFFEIATIGGMALGFSLGGWLWQHFGTPVHFGILHLTSPAFALDALLYLASFFVLWLGIREVGQQKRATPPATPISSSDSIWHRYLVILRNPRVMGFAPAWIAINAVLGVWINLIARVLTDRRLIPGQLLVGGFNSAQAGNIIAGFAVFFVLGILVWTIFATGWKKITSMMVGTAGLLASCVLLFALNHQTEIGAPIFVVLTIILVVSIMVQSGFTPAALAHLANITEEHAGDRGAIMGLYSVFLGLGQFLGSSLGGPFVDAWGMDGIAYSTGLLGVVAAVFLFRLRRTEGELLPSGVAPSPIHKR